MRFTKKRRSRGKNQKKLSQPNVVTFQGIQPGTQWIFRRLNQQAGHLRSNGSKVSIGFPKITQTVYPGQTLRVNSGWAVDPIPADTSMHTYPHKSLLQSNLISMPQVKDATEGQNEVVQVVLNSSEHPIQILLKDDGDLKFMKLHPQTLQQMLQLDFGSLFQTTLGVAAKVLPLFL